MYNNIPIEISARHVHLSEEHLDILFGKGHKLNIYKELSQPGQFSAEEKVAIISANGRLENIRVIGPCRSVTQVEISMTDSRFLGIDAPIRESGKIEGTPGLTITGPKGEIIIKEGVIIALRHLHIDLGTAVKFGVNSGDMVGVEVKGERRLMFENVVDRASKDFRLAFHIDTDEANAAGINGENHLGSLIINRKKSTIFSILHLARKNPGQVEKE